MAVEITLTVGKDGLRISQKLEPNSVLSSNQDFIEQKRLKTSFAETQADQTANSGTSSGTGQGVGGRPRDPGGPGGRPRDPGGPGGTFSPLGSGSGTLSLIGPIVITPCCCLRHEHKQEPAEAESNINA